MKFKFTFPRELTVDAQLIGSDLDIDLLNTVESYLYEMENHCHQRIANPPADQKDWLALTLGDLKTIRSSLEEIASIRAQIEALA